MQTLNFKTLCRHSQSVSFPLCNLAAKYVPFLTFSRYFHCVYPCSLQWLCNPIFGFSCHSATLIHSLCSPVTLNSSVYRCMHHAASLLLKTVFMFVTFAIDICPHSKRILTEAQWFQRTHSQTSPPVVDFQFYSVRSLELFPAFINS